MGYDLLLFGHIVAAIAWIGSGFGLLIVATMADRRRDDIAFATLLRYNETLALRLFVPASLGTFVFGVLLVADGPWTVDQLWIVLALAGFAATFLTGILVFKPRGDKLAALIERDGGALGPEAMRGARELLMLARLDYVVLLTVVFDMAVKPTGDDVWALVLMAAAVVAGTVSVVGRARAVATA